jgi:DNA-binding LacI/PurR family transcriptional regulator
MTVSWVLNKPERVHFTTRERVLDAITRLNYAPSAIARGLTRQRMNTLGVVRVEWGSVKVMSDPYYGHILEGVLTRSRDRQQKTLLYIEKDWAQASEAITKFSDKQADGLLLIIPLGADNLITVLEQRGVPFVIIGDYRPEANLATVDVDNVATGRMATQYLIDAGHRKIAHISGSPQHISSGHRILGYKQALTSAGITVVSSMIVEGTYLIESGYDGTNTLLKLPENLVPSAIFCADDPTAFGALNCLAERGIKVPEEMSVIGVNGGQDAMERDLTTLRQPFEGIGSSATDLLLEMIDTGTSTGKKIILPPTIVAGHTVGPPQHN